MNNVRLGQFGVFLAGLGIAAEWWTFMAGKDAAVVLGTGLLGFFGIILTLTAAVREG